MGVSRLAARVCLLVMVGYCGLALMGVPVSFGTAPRHSPQPTSSHSRAAEQPRLARIAAPPDDSPCSAAEADFQKRYFSIFSDMGRRFGCVGDKWEELMAVAIPDASTFIDIGMNKGYSSANYFALWSPESGFTPQIVYKHLRNVKRGSGEQEDMCGACHDCSQVWKPPRKQSIRSVRVLAFEPGLRNFERCEMIKATQIKGLGWEQYRMAVSAKPGTATFPVDSGEVGSIGEGGIVTTITTVDQIFADHNLSFVDVMKIDTEGFDASVIAGGAAAFAAHRIGTVLFEYHKLNMWWVVSLESVVSSMDKIGYSCYLAGKDYVLKLTSCWRPMMEFKWWSNVMCASRVNAASVVEMLEHFSFHKKGKADWDGVPESKLPRGWKGFDSKFVYGAPQHDSWPPQDKFKWAI